MLARAQIQTFGKGSLPSVDYLVDILNSIYVQ